MRLTIVPKRRRVKRIPGWPLVWGREGGSDHLYSVRARDAEGALGGERLEARAAAGGDDAARHRKVGGEHDDVGIGVALEKAAAGPARRARPGAETTVPLGLGH